MAVPELLPTPAMPWRGAPIARSLRDHTLNIDADKRPVVMAIETVLLALSDRADHDELVALAVDIAEPRGATVVIARVYDEETHAATGQELNISSPDELAARDTAVADVLARLEEADVSTAVRVAVGDRGHSFVELAERSAADLVLIQGDKRSPAGKAVFGSVSQEVLLNAPCPVTFLRS